MIQDQAQGILQHHAKEYTREILNYVEKYSDNMVARKLFPVRNVGKDVEIDVVTTYEKRSGDGAVVCGKGVVPSGSGARASSANHTIYQILDGFSIHEKDLKLDPKLKNRNVDICMRNVHKTEDDLAINGQTNLNLDGIVDVVPSGNKITTATNNGKWDGSESNDIYQDVLTAIGMLDGDFDPSWIVGNPTDINYLNGMDSERQPYWKTIIDLFPSAKKKEDVFFKSNRVTAGNVYVGCKDPMAGEVVVSENATVATIPMQPGRIYPIEIYEWVTVELHTADCFAEIATG